MNESKKTFMFLGVAILLAAAAYFSSPTSRAPDAFFDVGEEFFPEFTDPNDAVSLEVIDFNEESGSALPFKVEFKDGLWRIPSHLNYPADGKDRLAKTAAGVIGITKDDFRTDNVADHEAAGVIDPLDDTILTLKGRGKRVTLKGNNDKILADFIVGKEVEGAEGFRFVRVPGQKRVYAAKMDIDLSTSFSDWIETDVLQVDREDIQKVVLQDYSIDERTRAVQHRDTLMLNKSGGIWTADKMTPEQEVDKTKMDNLLTAVDELKIVDVRKKPAGLSEELSSMTGNLTISQPDILSLQSKGYYLGSNGQLLSNEGEMNCETTGGIRYVLRFGEVVYSSGADGDSTDSKVEDSGDLEENRYLFIAVEFREDMFPEPAQPANMAFKEKEQDAWTPEDHENKRLNDAYESWQQQVAAARERAMQLSQRFADWYYIISSSSFDSLNLTRNDLVVAKPKKDPS